jgi:hypothetical protein
LLNVEARPPIRRLEEPRCNCLKDLCRRQISGTNLQTKTGLGTGIIKALAHDLNAKVETLAGPEGTTVSVTHATFAATVARSA